MGHEETRQRVPAHLRKHVVEQDWDAYTPVDHAVWRFVLTQLYDRLVDSAHPAYARGLEQTGMGVERIPRIAEMDACLRRFGWGAVCVDGFIPPRAFQEFQALGILPIAADIRRVEHLAYTPAPDIIHEAGGHAPILPDPEYAAFLRLIGEYGMRAFGSRHDAELYGAIRELSVVKERRDATAREVEAAEGRLAELAAREVPASEAAQLARLYWWTVEYGLVGTPEDYRLYGAGLLSSLGESHFCHDDAVRKLPLDPGCVEVSYDITRQQPQLFVARDFVQLGDVLEAACLGFAFRRGGVDGLRVALDSGEVATLTLDTGLSVIGRVARVEQVGEAVAAVLDGPCGVALHGVLLEAHRPEALCDGLCVLLGRDDGLSLQADGPAAASPLMTFHRRARLLRGDEPLHAGPLLQAAGTVSAVMRGAIDADYWPAVPWPGERVPARSAAAEMHDLYVGVERAGSDVGALARIDEALEARHPGEWLLRFYLLQALQRLDAEPRRRAQLVARLSQLERHYGGRCPIATGLRYLGHELAA